MNYLNVKSGKKTYQASSEHMRLHIEKERNAIRASQHKIKMAKYRNLHELDLTDPQEPDDYDKALTADPAYKKFIDELENIPF